jgi:hypothetical protein
MLVISGTAPHHGCRHGVTDGGARRHVEQCNVAGPPASPTTHAATVTVQNARDWRAPNGSRFDKPNLLPVPYFHVVFNLPASAAEIAFQNKTVVYAMLFRAAAETDPKHLARFPRQHPLGRVPKKVLPSGARAGWLFYKWRTCVPDD